jgi:NAD(P)-dependent dehydrogenase (short-subunit alcohol dehydrogenase family)
MPVVSGTDWDTLQRRTTDLLAVSGEAGAKEFSRFQQIRTRTLDVDRAALHQAHNGSRILVTGGTGCIGSTLLTELAGLRPARLASVSRGVTATWASVPTVDYFQADIRDRDALGKVFDEVRPDIVYHLAAQHDPGLAEIEIGRTLSTNVTGTANVIAACLPHASRLIHASTGKALRPFSSDIYAASKKLGEWLLTQAMGADQLVAAGARFTHVVDNSIIYERLGSWTETRSPMRLHSPDASFYLQSALEAAQLLMCAGLQAVGTELRMAAIRDLGWPISLIDLALGWLVSREEQLPLYICGFEAGYDIAAYPGLYDPRISGDRSPLFNSLEAPNATVSDYSSDVDVLAVDLQKDPATLDLINRLGESAAGTADPAALRAQLDGCGWAVLASSLGTLPQQTLSRHLELVRQVPHGNFGAADREVVNAVFWEMHLRGQLHYTGGVSPSPVAGPAIQCNPARAVIDATPIPRQRTRTFRAAPTIAVDLTVVIPTLDDGARIAPFLQRLFATCRAGSIEVVVVDDSVDDTPELIRAAAGAADFPIRLLHRSAAQRKGGRSGAVAAGAAMALGRYVVVMDGGLRQPPELIPMLRELVGDGGAQLAVATRYTGRRGAVSLHGKRRSPASALPTLAARMLFPQRVGRTCSDPGTGFFCVDTRVVDFGRLRPAGSTILLDILVTHDLTVAEIPFVTEDEPAHHSRAALVDGGHYLRQLIRLRSGRA